MQALRFVFPRRVLNLRGKRYLKKAGERNLEGSQGRNTTQLRYEIRSRSVESLARYARTAFKEYLVRSDATLLETSRFSYMEFLCKFSQLCNFKRICLNERKNSTNDLSTKFLRLSISMLRNSIDRVAAIWSFWFRDSKVDKFEVLNIFKFWIGKSERLEVGSFENVKSRISWIVWKAWYLMIVSFGSFQQRRSSLNLRFTNILIRYFNIPIQRPKTLRLSIFKVYLLLRDWNAREFEKSPIQDLDPTNRSSNNNSLLNYAQLHNFLFLIQLFRNKSSYDIL